MDADFVCDTLDRVLSDRERIEFEASLVDAIRFEHGDLESYAAPVPSPDFVETTLARVLVQRTADRQLRTDAEEQFQALIEDSLVPEPSADFVDRTLAAVLAQRSAGPAPVHRPVFGGRLGGRFSRVASVAALILCAVAVFWPDRGRQPRPTPTLTAPVSFGSLILEGDRSRSSLVLPITIDHELQTLLDEQDAPGGAEDDPPIDKAQGADGK